MGPDPALEWPFTLDVPALVASGWRPVPFREFIVKVHSRCDLSCDYCYMYEMAYQSWHDRPRLLPAEMNEPPGNDASDRGDQADDEHQDVDPDGLPGAALDGLDQPKRHRLPSVRGTCW